MTIQKMREADELIRKIKSANSVLDAICDQEGKPKENNAGVILSKLFTEYRNVSSDSYKNQLAIVAFDAVVSSLRADIINLEKQFEEL